MFQPLGWPILSLSHVPINPIYYLNKEHLCVLCLLMIRVTNAEMLIRSQSQDRLMAALFKHFSRVMKMSFNYRHTILHVRVKVKVCA